MFKKVFRSISKTLAGIDEAKPGTWVTPKTKTSDKARNLIDRISASLKLPGDKSSTGPSAAAAKPKSPEELCNITPKMTKDEIKARLAFLYRRYNRATSSLDAKLRAEAETMLDAIVAVREKIFGPI
jgi:hypothetical protein